MIGPHLFEADHVGSPIINPLKILPLLVIKEVPVATGTLIVIVLGELLSELNIPSKNNFAIYYLPVDPCEAPCIVLKIKRHCILPALSYHKDSIPLSVSLIQVFVLLSS